MSKRAARGVWNLARAILFYPAAFSIMIWLTLTGQHWGWGIAVIAAVLIFDPIYRIIGASILKWRPAPKKD